MSDLTGTTALVTGASRGIGRAAAERLAAAGALVAVHYNTNEAAAKDTVATIEAAGGRAFPVQATLGVPGDVDTLFTALEAGLREHTGSTRLDILVNNAGTGAGRPIEAVTPESFDEVFAVNVKAPFFITQRALGLIPDGGRVINVSSSNTRAVMPVVIDYSMGKGALDTFTRTLAHAVGPRNITVNSVVPGPTDTDMIAFIRDMPEAQAAIAGMSTLGRIGKPGDIADVIAFLASDQARWITGTTIDATGGMWLGPRMG